MPLPTNYLIGHRIPEDRLHPVARVTARSGQSQEWGPSDLLSQTGWLSTFEDGRVIRTASVNFDPAEAEDARIPVSEFQLRLCHAEPAAPRGTDRTIIPGEQTPRVEHGFAIVLIVALALVFENVYAARLGTA
jgi:hypothetical protein